MKFHFLCVVVNRIHDVDENAQGRVKDLMLETEGMGKMSKTTPHIMCTSQLSFISCNNYAQHTHTHRTAWAVHLFLKNLVTLTTQTKEAKATNRLTSESIREVCESNKSYEFLKSKIDTRFSAPAKRASSTIITTTSTSKKRRKKEKDVSAPMKNETNKDEPEITEDTVFDGESRTFDDVSVFII